MLQKEEIRFHFSWVFAGYFQVYVTVYSYKTIQSFCPLIDHTRKYDLLAEYMRRFHENINRVWVKTSKYGGKIAQIFKRVYSFNRDLRVVAFVKKRKL